MKRHTPIFITEKPRCSFWWFLAIVILVGICLSIGGCDEKNKQKPSETIITDPGARDIIGSIPPSEEVPSIMQRVELQAKIDRQRTDLVNLEKEKNAEIERLHKELDARIARDAAHQDAIDGVTRHWSWASIAALGIAILAGFVFGWKKSIPVFVVAGGTALWAVVTGSETVQTFAGIVAICLIVVIGVAAVVYMWMNWRTSQQANRKRELRKVKLMEGKIDEAEVLAAEAAVLDRVATKQYDHRIVEPTSEKKRKAA